MAMKDDLPAVELDDDLARAVVIHFFEFAYVACGIVSQQCCERLNVDFKQISENV